MQISASIINAGQINEAKVTTNEIAKQLTIPSKPDDKGSLINGGELLFLALATCFCNDVYREAAKRRIEVRSVNVTVSGAFGAEGEPARDIHYSVKIEADASEEELSSLVKHVDEVAEIHNTLRVGTAVTLTTTH